MSYNSNIRFIPIAALALLTSACGIPHSLSKTENRSTPKQYNVSETGVHSDAEIIQQKFFPDPYLRDLIDTALANNKELGIVLQEIEIARNEVRIRKGEYLPSVGLRAGAGLDKESRYTNIGAMEANTEIVPGKEMPDPLGDLALGLVAHWEVDIWHKLRNAKKAAMFRYMATVEGKNFVITNLVAEVANSYYELLALDNQLEIIQQNIEIQSSALQVVKLQMDAARVTQLAVSRFEAEVAKTKSLQYNVQQQIVETENKINFLLGRFPQHIARSNNGLSNEIPTFPKAGIPAQLLENRTDIRQAEQELAAAKLDIKVAKAQFYPSLGINAGAGLQAFNPSYFFSAPASIAYSLIGDLVTPLVNRNAIKAYYLNANAKQIQAAYNYEKTLLNAYVEVANQLSKMQNLSKSYKLRDQQVQALTQSVGYANDLFKSARADYMEVLMTQRDALESKFELVETKKQQMNAMVNIYRALGGGWK
ncbi:MAG: TolC family protein [Bacteroidetes bacterium]|nr:TolC family protein [Bacteroidota bacterium]